MQWRSKETLCITSGSILKRWFSAAGILKCIYSSPDRALNLCETSLNQDSSGTVMLYECAKANELRHKMFFICVLAVVHSNNPIASFKECQHAKHRQAINYSFLNVNLIVHQLKLSKYLIAGCYQLKTWIFPVHFHHYRRIINPFSLRENQ